MKTLPREEANIEFDKIWNELKEEWFKVEVLQDYSGEDMSESLKAWTDGNKEKSIELLKKESTSSEWVKMSGEIPAKKIRIHIVEKPFSDYLSWEIEVYKLINIPLAHEKVYLVEREKVKDLNIPDGDFMIFDNKKVVRNYYTTEGKMYKADFYDGNDDINNFLDLKSTLLLESSSLEKAEIDFRVNL